VLKGLFKREAGLAIMIVVLDSNIWISQLGLNSTVGAAVRFFIKERKGRVALPEVIRLETEVNLRDNLNRYISDIKKKHRTLLTVFGQLKEVVLPSDEEVEKKVSQVFANTGLEIEDIPFSLENARKSYMRTIRKLPPSDRSQQFKDGLIWEDCVDLAKQDEVYFVTEDKAFFQDHDCLKGLNNVLAEEIKPLDHAIKILPSLDDLLEDIRVEVMLDERSLANSFYEQNKEIIDQLVKRNGFETEGQPRIERKLFATERPTVMYLNFTITYECKDITEEGRFGGILSIRGDGFYDSESSSFEQLKRLGEELCFKLKDGTEKQLRNYVLRAEGITIGHKEVTHTVRHEIE
jgi:hypothetical protein